MTAETITRRRLPLLKAAHKITLLRLKSAAPQVIFSLQNGLPKRISSMPQTTENQKQAITATSREKQQEDDLVSRKPTAAIAAEKYLYIFSHLNSTFSSIEDTDNNGRRVLLFVDVNIGAERQERITICEGDEASLVAKEFALLHSKNREYLRL